MDYHTEVIDKETGALYLMRCTQSISLSHSSVNELCLLSQALLEVVAKKINAHVQQNIRDHSIEVSDSFKEDIGNACNLENIFDGLHNKYNRERFYENAFNYVVSNDNTRTTHLFNIKTIICTYGRELGVANCQ